MDFYFCILIWYSLRASRKPIRMEDCQERNRTGTSTVERGRGTEMRRRYGSGRESGEGELCSTTKCWHRSSLPGGYKNPVVLSFIFSFHFFFIITSPACFSSRSLVRPHFLSSLAAFFLCLSFDNLAPQMLLLTGGIQLEFISASFLFSTCLPSQWTSLLNDSQTVKPQL